MSLIGRLRNSDDVLYVEKKRPRPPWEHYIQADAIANHMAGFVSLSCLFCLSSLTYFDCLSSQGKQIRILCVQSTRTPPIITRQIVHHTIAKKRSLK